MLTRTLITAVALSISSFSIASAQTASEWSRKSETVGQWAARVETLLQARVAVVCLSAKMPKECGEEFADVKTTAQILQMKQLQLFVSMVGQDSGTTIPAVIRLDIKAYTVLLQKQLDKLNVQYSQ